MQLDWRDTIGGLVFDWEMALVVQFWACVKSPIKKRADFPAYLRKS